MGCLPAVKGLVLGTVKGLAPRAPASMGAAISVLRSLRLTEQLATLPGFWQGLAQLTNLTQLELELQGAGQWPRAEQDSGLLAVQALSGLRCLRLGNMEPAQGVQLLPALTGLECLQLRGPRRWGANWALLLPAVCGLTWLTRLQLDDLEGLCQEQDLSILPTSLVELELPEHALPTGWGELPQLRHLRATGNM